MKKAARLLIALLSLSFGLGVVAENAVAAQKKARPAAAKKYKQSSSKKTTAHKSAFQESGHLLSAPTCYPAHGFYMSPQTEGLRSAGTVELGGLDRPSREVRTRIIAEKTRRFLPDIGEAGRDWLGFRPSMPDSLPVIGTSPRDRRVVYAFGHGHIGLTLGGITGRIVSELISGLPPSVDISALRSDRF